MYASRGWDFLRTWGRLEEPGTNMLAPPMKDKKAEFEYMAGGPVYKLEDGGLLLAYHTEYHLDSYYIYFSAIGLAVSYDDGRSFTDLGLVLTTGLDKDKWLDWGYDFEKYPTLRHVDMRGAPIAISDGFLYIYFTDIFFNGDELSGTNMAVARASLEEITEAAKSGETPVMKKYYMGAWEEPGLGGVSSELFGPEMIGAYGGAWWYDVSFNTHLNKYLMIYSSAIVADICVTVSEDGLVWEPPLRLVHEPNEQIYVSIIGEHGNADRVSGKSFYVYYTDSVMGGFERWDDAELHRRLIEIN